MQKALILAAFEKAKREIGSDKKSRRAQHLSDYLREHCKEILGEKSLTNYYNSASGQDDKALDLRQGIILGLCSYLECEDLRDFERKFGSDPHPHKKQMAHSPWKLGLLIGVVAVLGIAVAVFLARDAAGEPPDKRFMVWRGAKYEEVPADQLVNIKAEDLQDYDKRLIAGFRKIPVPDCCYKYFDEKGSALLWYGKNARGELEYFTALAKHPETRKSLKEITRYMIRAHLCPSNED